MILLYHAKHELSSPLPYLNKPRRRMRESYRRFYLLKPVAQQLILLRYNKVLWRTKSARPRAAGYVLGIDDTTGVVYLLAFWYFAVGGVVE